MKIVDWEADNWPCLASEIGPARCRLRDNLALARCAAALYCDLAGLLRSKRLAKHRAFLHWNADLSISLLREWIADEPTWFGPDLPLLRKGLLLDRDGAHDKDDSRSPDALAAAGPFDYGDGGRVGETWAEKSSGANSGDQKLIEKMSEAEAVHWVNRQEIAFAELITLGGLTGSNRASAMDGRWSSCRQIH
eukprot:SAG31_NODE_4113_length_3572_cov_24.306939_2_plen_192_part_00